MEVKPEVIASFLISGIISFLLWNFKNQLVKLVTSVDTLVRLSIVQGEKQREYDQNLKVLWRTKEDNEKRMQIVEKELSILKSHHNINHPKDKLDERK